MAGARDTARRLGGGLARGLRRGLARRALPRDRRFWVSLDVPSAAGVAPGRAWGRERPGSLLDWLQVLDAVAGERRALGVLLRLEGRFGGPAAAESLRRGLDAARRRGKRVVVWAESLDLESLYVASAADRLWMPETGHVAALGLRAEAFYLRDLLARLDVRPEVLRVGTHKTAGETFTEDRMSAEQREQLEAILDDRFAVLVEGIAAGRGLSEAEVRDLVDRGPYTGAAAREAGLVDDCVYRGDLDERFAEAASRLADAPGRPTRIEARLLSALRASGAAREGWAPTPRIAWVRARGAIARGRATRGIASEALAARLARLAADRDVRAVVLRIESPGGDALASDLLWHAVRALRREKPVVASLGELAASGGYYLACAADSVLAERSAITGSIGVIGGKLDLSALYRRIGVGLDAVERGARAGMHSSARGFTTEEREALTVEMRDLYDVFVARVAEGRRLPIEAVRRAAEGRIWSGRRAHELGLVDAIGGPLEALQEARGRAGIRRGEPALLEVHPRRPPVSLRDLARWVS